MFLISAVSLREIKSGIRKRIRKKIRNTIQIKRKTNRPSESCSYSFTLLLILFLFVILIRLLISRPETAEIKNKNTHNARPRGLQCGWSGLVGDRPQLYEGQLLGQRVGGRNRTATFCRSEECFTEFSLGSYTGVVLAWGGMVLARVSRYPVPTGTSAVWLIN